ncbi:MAG: Uma2 family endonuclease [Myxococcota bacterium]|nr:Uma2 family endonuclease [Myxococcota bacterium]
MADAARPLVPDADDDQVVVIEGATWADYQRMLEIRGEKAIPRLTYLEGRLQLLRPSRAHESVKSMIGCLIEAWCVEVGVEITPYGSWTLERKEVERGVEPDECYVVGEHDDPELPGLAIEVVRTSGGVSKLEVYRKLGVREVWFWRRDTIELFALRGDRYEPIATSEVLPGIDHALLSRFVPEKPMTRAVRAYVRAIRDSRT